VLKPLYHQDPPISPCPVLLGADGWVWIEEGTLVLAFLHNVVLKLGGTTVLEVPAPTLTGPPIP
jgi:hypothetical protein